MDREPNDSHGGIFSNQMFCSLNAIQFRHNYIHDDHIWLRDGGLANSIFTNSCDIFVTYEQAHNALSNHRVVVHN